MGLVALPAVNGGFKYFPVTGAGTFTLQDPIPAGVYTFTTATDVSFTIAFLTPDGYKFTGSVRAGNGLISLPMAVDRIVIPSALTYPFTIGWQKIAYRQGAAPTFGSFTFTGTSGVNRVGTVTFTAPAGATGIGFFDRSGAFVDLGLTSPATNIPITAPVATGSTGTIALVARDANGVYGLPVEGVTAAAPSATFHASFTSSTTWTAPVSSVDALVVAGGGSGGAYQSTNGSGGGGGAGGMIVQAAQAVTVGQTYAITVGAGGAFVGTTAGGNNGGDSSLGSLLVAIGGGGGGNGTNGTAPKTGGSGGGGGGTGQGNTTQNGAAGTAGQGNAGGASVNSAGGGGGGGKSGVGAAAGAGGAGGAGLANDYSGTSVTYAAGGPGTTGSIAANPNPNTGNGGNGAAYGGGYGMAGAAGIVVLRWTL